MSSEGSGHWFQLSSTKGAIRKSIDHEDSKLMSSKSTYISICNKWSLFLFLSLFIHHLSSERERELKLFLSHLLWYVLLYIWLPAYLLLLSVAEYIFMQFSSGVYYVTDNYFSLSLLKLCSICKLYISFQHKSNNSRVFLKIYNIEGITNGPHKS